ncbi:SDR family NAD(P)-dependent oxidoreductase [Actinoplanes sp. NBRC 103695]|uniref:SDR family NAD(P)-dependent oxidoreductase n=1 Tax=Actinoplanes sp. NBRC 103695 TaxID=3032202 RepID=UPI0024A59D90|nr:SDR family NAD(P)-dependent oxidoreductase [Actinoplanes sp. NBRC 103695]GLZ01589.1 short-chain dehydrogenase [Actinoplanes sp. NBRC 103695]
MGSALITGATAGLGAAFVDALATRGMDLVLVARDEARLQREAARLRASGRVVEVLVADLADRSDVDRVASRLSDASAPIELLVNNAGFGLHTRLTTGPADLAELDRAIDVMARAVLVLSAAAGRAMRERGRGRTINVSSTAGFVSMGTYSAIKAFVTTFTESLANELHGTGVTVTALTPGWVHTEFHDRAGISKSKIPGPLWLDATFVAEQALHDADRGRVISNPSVRYKALIWFARHLPRSAMRGVSRALSGRRG